MAGTVLFIGLRSNSTALVTQVITPQLQQATRDDRQGVQAGRAADSCS